MARGWMVGIAVANAGAFLYNLQQGHLGSALVSLVVCAVLAGQVAGERPK